MLIMGGAPGGGSGCGCGLTKTQFGLTLLLFTFVPEPPTLLRARGPKQSANLTQAYVLTHGSRALRARSELGQQGRAAHNHASTARSELGAHAPCTSLQRMQPRAGRRSQRMREGTHLLLITVLQLPLITLHAHEAAISTP